MNKEKIVIKIGTNFIEKNGIKKIAEKIASLKKEGKDIVLVSSGAKGFGLKKMKEKENIVLSKNKSKVFASIGQILLMNDYYKFFEKEKINIAQILIAREINTSVINDLLRNNILPIVNGNDSETVEDLMFNDNDSLAGEIALKVHAKKLIIITDIDGVYDSNPYKNKKAKKFNMLNKITKKLLGESKSVGSKYGTGGMYTKLKISEKMLKNNIEVYITSSLNDVENYIKNNKRKGTLIINNL